MRMAHQDLKPQVITDKEKGVEIPSVMQICLKLSVQLPEMGVPTGQLIPPPQTLWAHNT